MTEKQLWKFLCALLLISGVILITTNPGTTGLLWIGSIVCYEKMDELT